MCFMHLDFNECSEGTDICGDFTVCSDKDPGYRCACIDEGYILLPGDLTCAGGSKNVTVFIIAQ